MIFSIGFVALPSPRNAFVAVGLRQNTEQAVSVRMPIIQNEDAPA